MMLTFNCTFEEFKRASKEFYDAAPTLNSDELDNAFKALGLMYMGMTDNKWEHSAAILFGMMSRVCTKRELELDNERTS
jgi:hypothetical protein